MRIVRKNYLVNRRLQLTLILGANVLALASVALIGTLMFYMQLQFDVWTATLGSIPGEQAAAYVAERQRGIVLASLLVGLVQFALFNGAALVLSHRIAGPLFRLERHLDEVADGKAPTDVAFRKGDLFQSLAVACNGVMARLRDALPQAERS